MSEKNPTQRSAYWDNAKGLLITLVVLGHYLYAYHNNEDLNLAGVIVGIIYVFHMPAFIFISGFFSRGENAQKPKILIKLAVAYVVFNFSMMGFSFLISGVKLSLLTPYYSYWYILVIIVWRLCIKSLNRVKGIVFISILVALLIGFMGEFTNILAVGRLVAFFPFFLLGYRLNPEKIQKFINGRKPFVKISGFILSAFSIYVAYMVTKTFGISQTDFLMGEYKDFKDVIVRLVIFFVSALVILCFGLAAPVKKLPILAKWGKNSLTIYLCHRIFTIIFAELFPARQYNAYYVIFALIASAATLFLFGTDYASNLLNKVLDKLTGILTGERENSDARSLRLLQSGIALCLVGILTLSAAQMFYTSKTQTSNENAALTEKMYPVITAAQEERIKNAVSIAFAGDLILLQDQIRNAYNPESGQHEFAPIFEFAGKYLSQADYAIGVFEGPIAGEAAGYSTSNYDDGIEVRLNFPASFADAVKASGIDLVTLANNHLLDKGVDGALSTLDALDEVGLDCTGAYRNTQEKNKSKIIEVKGLRVAVLAYTFGSNYYSEDYFLTQNSTITSTLCPPESKNFKKVKAQVINDIDRAKEQAVDLIMVLPHMGTQFEHTTDAYQNTWNNVFIEAGADLVLGDHAHAVQPIEFRTVKAAQGEEKTAVIVNCPGNFVNSYTEHNGDATSIVEVYLDPETGHVICAAVIPMWTQSTLEGSFRAIPLYDIMNNPVLQSQVSTNDKKRVEEVHALITKVMLGEQNLTLDQLRERYFLFKEGYARERTIPMTITPQQKTGSLYNKLANGTSVCFTGDSVTQGNKNGGYGWYEPMAAAFPALTVYKQAWGGATTKILLEKADLIAGCKADLYVVAVGTNDVRYRDEKICAIDSTAYVNNLQALTEKILAANPNASFVFVSPWPALENDTVTKLPVEQRDVMLAEYTAALKEFCNTQGHVFIDPAAELKKTLEFFPPSDYLIDYIHPNADKGINLYSGAVLSY